MEEALVLGVAELLEGALVAVAVVLRRLHHGDLRVAEVRHHVLEPVAVDAVVRVDHRHHFGVRRGVRQDVVQRAALEAFDRCHVEEAEARAQLGAVGFHRLPHGRVLGVVVDDDDFVIRVVQRSERVEGLFDHLRRLVVAGHVDRHLGSVGAVGQYRQEGAAALAGPGGFGQFVGLGEQDDEHAQCADAQQHADDGAEPGAVLLAVVVGDPHQRGAAGEGDEGEEGAAALAQGRTVDQHQGQGQQGHDHRGDGQQAPLRNGDDGTVEAEFGLAGQVVDAPVGAHGTFFGGLPRLVEGFDDEVVVALGVQRVDQGAQVDGLFGLVGFGAATGAAVARPAHFRQQQGFFREQLAHFPGAVEDELGGVLHRHEFPVGQHVGGDQVGVLGQFRVLVPDVPLLGSGHRHLDRGAHAVEVAHQLFGFDFLAEQRFVADDHAHHAARAVSQLDGLGDFPFVALDVRTDPDTQADAQTELLGQARDVGQGAFHRIGADVVGALAE